jgi:hypothetical protein
VDPPTSSSSSCCYQQCCYRTYDLCYYQQVFSQAVSSVATVRMTYYINTWILNCGSHRPSSRPAGRPIIRTLNERRRQNGEFKKVKANWSIQIQANTLEVASRECENLRETWIRKHGLRPWIRNRNDNHFIRKFSFTSLSHVLFIN